MPSVITAADAIPLASDAVLALYDTRAAAQAIERIAQAKIVEAAAKRADQAPTPSRAITLTLTTSKTPAQPVAVRYSSPGSAGTPPTTGTQPPSTDVTTTIVLDVSVLGGQGFAQSISEHSEAHQTIHQTASGFYVDNYGMKPGDFTLSAIIVFHDNVFAQIQAFKLLLSNAKNFASSPTYVSPPPRLLYTNSIDGRKLLLTQTSLDVEQSVDNPNQATVTIKANILTDYSTGASPVAAPVALTSYDNTLTLVTQPNGSVTNNTLALAGVAALGNA